MRTFIYITILLVSTQAFCQRDSLIHVELVVGGGWGIRTSHINIPDNQLDISTISPCGSLRLMWKPQHLLSAGIESGYLAISQVESKGALKPDEEDGNANLAAIPILATFAMDQDGVEFAAGIGVYSLMVSGRSSKGKGIKNSAIELGYAFGASYTYPLSQTVGLGLQVKYYVFTDRQIAMIVPQLRLAWSLLNY